MVAHPCVEIVLHSVRAFVRLVLAFCVLSSLDYRGDRGRVLRMNPGIILGNDERESGAKGRSVGAGGSRSIKTTSVGDVCYEIARLQRGQRAGVENESRVMFGE